ncbi:MAG: Crp/Fnr family transcriptional regulator [Bacillota bacterium]|nr:Crp/Fnr family transcriptional regulator [Bacillota bacterium]
MKKYYEILNKCPLFHGIAEAELDSVLECLSAGITAYKKNEIIFLEGSPARYVGIVLSGEVRIVKEDFFGNRSIVSRSGPGELFGESFACAGTEVLPVSVSSAYDSEVMMIDCRRITMTCSHSCSFHNRIIFNLLRVVAEKNLEFNKKIEITSKRTTREKLMTYLMFEAKRNRSNSFTIPFDRQVLADYLEVDRSGLSAEISRLRKDGVIECSRSRFTLLET